MCVLEWVYHKKVGVDMIQKAEKILSTYFGYDTFREGQKKVIKQILNGEDTLCLMPTGGGKSICYQVPSLV